ncbi:MAG: hypothetical protein AAFS10_28355, partial [Myxococcota bacterium]
TPPPANRAQLRPPIVDEMRPTTLDGYASKPSTIATFEAVFPNAYHIRSVLPIPSQEEIRDDGVTFCWCPFDQALREAGPLTKRVLHAMEPHLEGHKRFIYIDTKIQYFRAGDVPVDSQHWHVDGSIVARGPQVQALGHNLLHDMKARLQRPSLSPKLLAYQSSRHCATRFVTVPVSLTMPELIPNFDGLDQAVRTLDPPCEAQPASSIVSFDGLSLHRATAAEDDGWRLWVRCIETDREVHLTRPIINCYGTVFRTLPQ